jgi:hypothetical protein
MLLVLWVIVPVKPDLTKTKPLKGSACGFQRAYVIF